MRTAEEVGALGDGVFPVHGQEALLAHMGACAMQQRDRSVGVAVWLAGVAMMAIAPAVPAQSLPPSVGVGRLQGVVYDSIARRPLRGALVQVALRDQPAVSRSLRTDDAGRFVLDSLAEGVWMLAALHSRLDSLGVPPLVREVRVRAKRTERLTLAVPSPRSLYTQVCGEASPNDSAGVLLGQLRHVQTGPLAAPGTVQLQWLDLVVNVGRGGGVSRSMQRVEVPTSATGAFVACGVPAGGALRVQGAQGADSTGIIEVTVPTHGLARVNLAIGSAIRLPVSVASEQPDSLRGATASASAGAVVDTTGAARALGSYDLLRGAGTLQGRATGLGERPLSNARVTVWGTGLETSTDDRGQYVMRGLPTGTHTVEIRAIGYTPARQAVDILPGEGTQVETSLERLATLDTVQVRAMRLRLMGRDMREFEARRLKGLGVFRGPEELERMQPFSIADMLRTVPGVRIVPSRFGELVLLRGNGQDLCIPEVYIDRTRMFGTIEDPLLDAFLQANEVRAVEVYSSTMGAPPEFTTQSTCGVLVFWTGPRR